MLEISPDELGNFLTLITNFMCERTLENKTFNELVTIFTKCYKGYSNDYSNDLRILDYEKSMNEGRWDGPIILTRSQHNGIIDDGIHRGIAYLRCVNSKVNEEKLPRVYII